MNVEMFRNALAAVLAEAELAEGQPDMAEFIESLEFGMSLVEDKKESFVYLIGSSDHFESIEKLVEFYSANEGLVSFYGSEGPRNSSRYEVEAADADTALLLGYGLAFKDDWCMEHTVSFLLKGE